MMNEVDGKKQEDYFERLGDAYGNERSVILKEEDEG